MSRTDDDFLAERFEAHRPRLRAVAHRMLGSVAEADDAVQEAWFRLSRAAGSGRVENLGGWLTTVVGRVCLDMLRSRKSRAEEPLEADDGPTERPGRTGHPGPTGLAGLADPADPEQDALLADTVGVALLVVLDTLTPAERLAFVLHDLFAVPFEEIAGILGRNPAAARQLASRARRRVRGPHGVPGADPARQRALVDAFLAAARAGDFDGLLKVLDPDVVARSELGVTTGAAAVATGATTYARFAGAAVAALVDGAPGAVVLADGRPERALVFTVVRDRIAVLDIVTDPARLAELDLDPGPEPG
ncbi:sigma-70 family RNA polymerase sigma factor [Streptomyces sp. GbtcB6]|uniref:sigma-70 family RNA polymerase sigma factor n=1 Tax=Streptomyces sp. GbtcB6 TaxID=2824751 RepID=UPI001C30DC18|nr:sigma-70 family RNA polymerase sigma factor [Streptomyces sp. GbtcB6]